MEKQLEAAKQAAKEKAQQLSEQLGVKVHPLVFVVEADGGEPVTGFLKEPPRAVKLAIMDKYNQGFYSACDQALDVVLLKEESDPRISSEKSEHDVYRMGAVTYLSEMIQYAANQVDKKK